MSPARFPEKKCKRRCVCPRFGTAILRAQKGEQRYIMMKYVMVGIGGAVGSVLRFWVGCYLGEQIGTRFPCATFAVNITGSFLIGFIVTLLASKTNWDPNLRYLIPVGFIGGYTTFSACEYETLRSVQDGNILVAALNVILSVTLGFAAVWLGTVAGRSLE